MNSILVLLVLSALTHGSCTAPSINCPTPVATCNSVNGCYLQRASTAHCSTPSCDGIAQTSCASTPGCIWQSYSGGDCRSKDNTCYEKTTQSACTNAKCGWYEPTESGYCHSKIDCYSISEQKCKDTSNNCVWKPNYCGGPNSCSRLPEAKCKKEETGCEWHSNEFGGGGDCQTASSLNCQNNSTNTGCDASSDFGCWWQSGDCENGPNPCYTLSNKDACDAAGSSVCEWSVAVGYCYSDCHVNDARDGCADGSPSYCEWKTYTSYCDEADLYCQTKVDGSGCTSNSDQGCKLYDAAPESCALDDDMAEFCSQEGGSCGAEALSYGCVDSSTAFTVRTPSLLAFVAVLSFLLL